MSLTVLGIGTAIPEGTIAQTDAAVMAAGFGNVPRGRERLLDAIYRQTRIRTRASVLLEATHTGVRPMPFYPPIDSDSGGGPTTRTRMERYRELAGALALKAAEPALDDAGIDAAAVTHLVTCSCTGFANPGLDLELFPALGLQPRVSRTHVGFMGCHGAFNALRVAEAFATADPAAVVLVVCVELCSLHFQYGSRSDHVVANSIFADGSAAVVGVGPRHPRGGERGRWRLERQASQVLADSTDQMGWIIGDNGFEMTLSAAVPGTIARDIGRLVADLVAAYGIGMAEIGSWAVHPGGPRVLTSVQEALMLDAAALQASRDVLADHGNMSSGTILFILERLMRATAPTPCIAMAFGPGLTAEMAVFDRC